MSDPRITTPAAPAQAMLVCKEARAALRAKPSVSAAMTSEVLFGESITLHERENGHALVQCARDSYVGWLREDALGEMRAPTHRIRTRSTPLLSAPDVKQPAYDLLPLNALVQVMSEEGAFARLPQGYVFANHLTPLKNTEPDWVAIAESFTGAPYLWGGRTIAGLDCSGLVQTALQAGGIACPRDTDMQEKAFNTVTGTFQRGDLVFWKGHVAIARDATNLIHANAFFMEVTVEPAETAIARIGPPTSVKRPG